MKVLIDPPWAAIAAVLTEMDVELEVREQRQATTRALKQSMMQKLPIGRTRRGGPHAPIP